MNLKNPHSASRPTRGAKSHWWKWNFSYADAKPLNQAGWTEEDWAAFTKKPKRRSGWEPATTKETRPRNN